MTWTRVVMLEMKNWNSPYALGPAYNTINWDLNLSTGRGAIWGSAVHYPTAFPGSEWHCSFRMPFDGAGGYAGKGVCQGTGKLAGWQWRVNLAVAPLGLHRARRPSWGFCALVSLTHANRRRRHLPGAWQLQCRCRVRHLQGPRQRLPGTLSPAGSRPASVPRPSRGS